MTETARLAQNTIDRHWRPADAYAAHLETQDKMRAIAKRAIATLHVRVHAEARNPYVAATTANRRKPGINRLAAAMRRLPILLS